jgi:hypothetical protein
MTFYIGTAIPLADIDLTVLSVRHGLEEAALRAVIAVETNGKGFTPAGAVIALYEPHVAYRNTSGTIRNALVKAGIAYQKWRAGSYPKSSYPRIDQCAKVAGEEVACLATSWGLPQILGENFKAAGFGSALEMVKFMAVSEKNQVEAMVNFIADNPKMRAALKGHDWPTFARLYNGAGYKKNAYDTKLASAYKKAAAMVAARKPASPPPAPVEAPKPVPAPIDAPKAQPSPAPAPEASSKHVGIFGALVLLVGAVAAWWHDAFGWLAAHWPF